MALQHAASGERIALRRGDEDIAFFTSVALVKTEHMELIRLVVSKDKPLPEHKVDGEVTIQCLEGELEVDCNGGTTVLRPYEMLYLLGGVPHAIRSSQDSVALMTMLLFRGDANVTTPARS